jgi:hypothetical protein
MKVVQNDIDVNEVVVQVFKADGSEIDYSDIAEALIVFTKPDYNVVQGNMEVRESDLYYVMGTNEIACQGTVKAQIQLVGSSGERLTIGGFSFEVLPDPVTPWTVQSSSEYSILKQLADSSAEAIEMLPDMQQVINEFPAIQQFFDTAEVSEAGRISAENTRQTQELARQASIEDIEERFDELTAQQQQEAEVINARTSTTKSKTFASLNARLEESETEAAAHKADMTNNVAQDYNAYNVKALNYSANALDYLVTPTYDGSGQTTHPKVLYFSNGWNGYKFWMAHTPYPNQTSAVENPSILASNDGITWVLPTGCPDPIEPKPSNGYNSDAHILMDGNTMELWWRAVINSGGEKSYIRRKKSTDGITWSATETLFIWGVTDILSPAVIYEDSKYKMWYVAFVNGVAKVCYNESLDAINWSERVVYDIDFTSKYRPWHLDVIKTNGKYEMTVMVRDSRGIGDLMYTYSYDNVNYSKAVPIMYHTDLPGNPQMTAWDRGSLYRSSLVWVDDKYYLFYAAYSYGSRIQHIGLSIGTTPYSLQYHNHAYIPIEVYRNTESDVAVHGTGTPLDYKRNSITYDYLSQAYATANGFPPYQGVLVTHNPHYGQGYLRQFYYVFRSTDIYTRSGINETTWTDWELMALNIKYITNTVLLTDAISAFPNNAITYHQITTAYGSANGFPEGQGGILVTENIKNTESGWQKQTYTTYSSKNIYVRFYKSSGWTDWYKYNLELNGIVPGHVIVTGTTIAAKSRYDFEIPIVGLKNTDTAVINFVSPLNVGLIANARCTTDKLIVEITNILDTDIIYSSRVVNYRIFKRGY